MRQPQAKKPEFERRAFGPTRYRHASVFVAAFLLTVLVPHGATPSQGLNGLSATAQAVGAGSQGEYAQSSPVTPASGYPPLSAEQIVEVRALLESFKQDARGPYLRIRWFCNDGTVLPPRPYGCRDHGGGHQHAEFKPEAARLAELGFHVGTILRATSFQEFYDTEHAHYRLRELVVEHYLEQYEDGWVLRRARYYRGARQIEDEERRGREFLERLLAAREWRASNPLLAGQLAAVVPHGQPGIPGGRIRSLAARIADLDPRFQDLRIKIHSRPGPEDLRGVEDYRATLTASAPVELEEAVDELQSALASLYTDSAYPERLRALATRLQSTTLGARVARLADELGGADDRERVRLLAELVRDARRVLTGEGTIPLDDSGGVALAVLDLANYANGLLSSYANAWIQEQNRRLGLTDLTSGVDTAGHLVERRRPSDRDSLPSRADILGFLVDLLHAIYGSGFLFDREYDALLSAAFKTLQLDSSANGPVSFGSDDLLGGDVGAVGSSAELSAATYKDLVQYLGHGVDWAQAAVQQTFGMVLERYRTVEPGAMGVRDDALRSSILLPYAAGIDILNRDASVAIGLLHSVFDVELHSGIAGLNPGVAVGHLMVIEDPGEARDLDPTGIYVLPETPADLGRVAGILTLEEGSRLSHVQLLARSLGLPNSVVSETLIPKLREFDGAAVFYAVSPLGTVVLKRMEAMTDQDLAILQEREAAGDEQFAIDESKLDLSVRRILDVDEVDLEDSGRIVGPKAANLGRLHRLFPDRVTPGLVIPFGVFRQHIDRDVEDSGQTLHEELLAIYEMAERAVADAADEEAINAWLLAQLEEVRETIIAMDFLPEFEAEIRATLRRRFGPDGSYGIFVRSDTNVEDLPNFTGAGLNLTVMNQIGTEEILSAIKRVWASVFSARSYTWRQRLLTTPENVYPSVILLRSVQVDVSGVLATIDLTRGDSGYWTVTLAEGVGGVVEGEPAETLLVPLTGDPPVLLSSARAVWQKVLRIAGSGGVEQVPVRGDPVLLTPARLRDLRRVATEILGRFPPVLDEQGSSMPWDIEFGFVGDRVTLFQIRPLVSNSRTTMLRALAAMDGAALEAGSSLIALDEPPAPQQVAR